VTVVYAVTNLVDSLQRGDRVIATGKLVAHGWTTDRGEKRTVLEPAVDEIGPLPEVGHRHRDADSPQGQRGADRCWPAGRRSTAVLDSANH